MMQMNLIENIPLPICGLILALLSLGNLFNDINPALKYIFGSIGLVFICLIVLKIIIYPKSVYNDFKNPIILSSCGTFSMSLMILSTYIIEYSPIISHSIWIIGVVLHIMLIIYFTYHFIMQNFNILNVYPSYWIVYVGITMSAITAQIHGIKEIGFIFFIIGFIAMIITLPLMIYRYIKYPDILNQNKPLICIFTAIFSILIVGYVNSADYISLMFLTAMYIVSCIFYVFALYKLISYRKLEFYPSFSAFTFPFVISTIASQKALFILTDSIPLRNLWKIELAIATIIVVYVLIRYLKFLKNSWKVEN